MWMSRSYAPKNPIQVWDETQKIAFLKRTFDNSEVGGHWFTLWKTPHTVGFCMHLNRSQFLNFYLEDNDVAKTNHALHDVMDKTVS